MGYNKLISYGDRVELYQYAKDTRALGKRKSTISVDSSVPGMVLARKHSVRPSESEATEKRRDNARRAALAFRRIVYANVGQSHDFVFLTLTYRENMEDVRQARKDFNAFARNVRNRFNTKVSYIAVIEFQKRGAIHYHALVWGIPSAISANERRARVVASLWGQGFVDIKIPDNRQDQSIKVARYLSKYMSKSYIDKRMLKKKHISVQRIFCARKCLEIA